MLPGTVNVGDYSAITFQDAQAFDNATVNLEGYNSTLQQSTSYAAYQANGYHSPSETLTLGSGVTIVQTGWSDTINSGGYGSGTIVNDGTIDVESGSLTIDPTTFVNNGTIDVTGGQLTLAGVWSNAATGTIAVVSGGSLYLEGGWSNAGTIDVENGGSLYLAGQTTLADLAGVQINGALTLSGTLALDGGTLDTTHGLFQNLSVDGGTIDPGVVIDGAGGTLSFSGSGSNVLADVTVEGHDPTGGMVINGGYVTLSNDVIEGGLTLNNATARLNDGSTVEDATGANPGAITLTDHSEVVLQGYTDLVDNVTLSSSTLDFAGAQPVSTTIDTGAGGLSGGSGDPNWTVNGNPAAVLSNVYYWGWQADSATSSWIGVNDSVYEPSAPYTFTTTFTVANSADTVMAGLFYIDDTGKISLNGNQLLSASGDYSGSLFLLDGADGLTTGINTLSVTMTSSDGYYDGTRVQMLAPVTIDPGVTVQGAGTINDNYGGEGQELVDNKGLIDANVSGAWLTVDPTAFINDATAEATDGAALQIGQNNGTYSATRSGSTRRTARFRPTARP